MTIAADVRIDPEFAALIPPPSAAERATLKALLFARGCEEDLTVWAEEGILLDGHNRRELCGELNIPFGVRELSFPDRDAAKEWVIAYQLGRRNLPTQVRGELVLEREAILKRRAAEASAANLRRGAEGPAPECQKSDTRETPAGNGRVDDQLAAEAGMSRDTLGKVRNIRDNAPPEVREKARKGEMTVNAADAATRAAQEAEAESDTTPEPEPHPSEIRLKRLARDAASLVTLFRDGGCIGADDEPDTHALRALVQDGAAGLGGEPKEDAARTSIALLLKTFRLLASHSNPLLTGQEWKKARR